jgi:hypothetical protein
MALDVYVGGFSRYYAGQWDPPDQRPLDAPQGGGQGVLGPSKPSDPVEWDEVSEAVDRWCEALNSGLGDNLDVPLAWDESSDTPYFTDRLGYEGYGALMVWAAYAEAGSTPPKQLAPDWYEDEVFVKYSKPANSDTYRAITATGLWLPGSFQFSFDFPFLTGDDVHITSNLALQEALEMLNSESLKLQPVELDEVLQEGYHQGAPLRDLATFGLSVFRSLCSKSEEHGLPIIIDS